MPEAVTAPIVIPACVNVISALFATDTLLVPLDIEDVLTPPTPLAIAVST